MPIQFWLQTPTAHREMLQHNGALRPGAVFVGAMSLRDVWFDPREIRALLREPITPAAAVQIFRTVGRRLDRQDRRSLKLALRSSIGQRLILTGC